MVKGLKYVLLLGIFLPGLSFSQINKERLVLLADSLMQRGVDESLIPGGVISICIPDSVLLLNGYGFSRLDSKTPVDPAMTLFQLGSVGKTFTAIAALQQVEHGKLELDKDVNTYLPTWKIENPYQGQVTLRNLLTHSAGFDDRVIGYMARSEKDLQSLGQHLQQNMPGLFEEPGKHINYSNYSYALAGHLVELASGEQFANYIHNNILSGLEMNSTTYHLPDDYDLIAKSHYSKGYQLRDSFLEVKAYPRHATPAGSILSTGEDMSKFVQALLNRDDRLLNKENYSLLLTQQFSNHKDLSGYTLGMEVQNLNGYYGVAKGGNVPGFLSLILLLPDDSIGIFMSVNTQTDNFLETFFDVLTRELFPLPSPDLSAERYSVDEYTGVYLNERTNHHTMEGFFMLFDGQFTLWKSSDGNLACFHNGKTWEYMPVEKDIFQNSENPFQRIVFMRNTHDKITNMFRTYSVGGIQVPATYRKASWFERPHFLNDEYPLVFLIIVAYGLLPFGWIIVFLVRRKRNPLFLSSTVIPSVHHAAALIFLALFLLNVLGFWVPLLQHRTQLLFGFDETLYSMRYFNYAMAFVAVGTVVLTLELWIQSHGNWLMRLFYTLFSLTSLSYVIVLWYWGFLTVDYKV